LLIPAARILRILLLRVALLTIWVLTLLTLLPGLAGLALLLARLTLLSWLLPRLLVLLWLPLARLALTGLVLVLPLIRHDRAPFVRILAFAGGKSRHVERRPWDLVLCRYPHRYFWPSRRQYSQIIGEAAQRCVLSLRVPEVANR
jgi:hypothetical protein